MSFLSFGWTRILSIDGPDSSMDVMFPVDLLRKFVGDDHHTTCSVLCIFVWFPFLWFIHNLLFDPLRHPFSVATVERMRAPVREAFSYGIRHWIRHIHCDSMSYDQIRVKP